VKKNIYKIMYNSTIVPPPENEGKMLAQQYTKATTEVHDGSCHISRLSGEDETGFLSFYLV
jgi:hypothetical protein